MSQTISFVNNTNSQIKIYGMPANTLMGCQNAVDCANGSYVVNPGMGLAALSSIDLPLFQLSATDFVFDVLLSAVTTAPSLLPKAALGGANQANYIGIIVVNAADYTVFIQDVTNIKTIKFINNTTETIKIQNIEADSLDKAALLFPSSSYPIASQATVLATIGDLPFFETFQLSATDFTFNVVLGINSIMADLNPPSNQDQYVAGMSYSENEYVITTSQLSSTNNVIFENQTSDQITIQSIGGWSVSSPFTNLTDAVVVAPNQNYVINPGTGSAKVNASVTQFVLTCADFAFSVDLNSLGTISPTQLEGVNQSGYAANIVKNGSLYTIVIAPSPLVPTIQFINNTQDIVTIAKELNDPNAFTNCLNNLSCSSESYLLNPGEGTCQIGDLKVNQAFQLVATDFTFNINLNSPGPLHPILGSGYVGLVSQIGNLYTVVIEKGSSGSGIPVSFQFTGNLTETLYSTSLSVTDYNNILMMQEEPIAVSVSLAGDYQATLNSCGCSWMCSDTTPNCSSCDIITLNMPSQFFLCSTSTNVDIASALLFVQLNGDPHSIIISSGVIPDSNGAEFLFPLSAEGSVSIVLSNSASSQLKLSNQTLNLGANYSFAVKNAPGALKKYNVGNIFSNGDFNFMFASTISNTIKSDMQVSGIISIQDKSGVPITFIISQSAQSSLTGSVSFGAIINVSFTGKLYLANGEVMISISGQISGSLPEFNYNNNLTGNVSLKFY